MDYVEVPLSFDNRLLAFRYGVDAALAGRELPRHSPAFDAAVMSAIRDVSYYAQRGLATDQVVADASRSFSRFLASINEPAPPDLPW